MEILKSNKNRNKLHLDGFMYMKKERRATYIRWECWRRKTYGCPGSLNTNLNEENPIVGKEHTHGVETTGVKVVKAKNAMKTKAKESSEKPANIVSETLEQADDATKANFPHEGTAKKMIRRQREPEFPGVPDNIAGITIPDECLGSNGRKSSCKI